MSDMMTVQQKIGQYLRDARHEHVEGGHTLREVAALVNISVSSLSDYEHGRSLPSVLVLLRLSRVLGVDLNAMTGSVLGRSDKKRGGREKKPRDSGKVSAK